ncbi:toprim domain-containing protein [Rhodococcus sp. H29-C3]|uniref:toprim domain-containing protein n=1 Tax=Rhodococcus sp. H29-C3 TaxID=3046307 RepID=UPI0024B8CDC0|nr:toprim domain-containing protein [Rhodococcus sp. H29-C3]MDJ0359704.1 toprim domain-containing protein [Rhodococcus sp. H29-C3]
MKAYERVVETFRDAGLIVDDKGHGRAAAQAPNHSTADRSVTITGIAGQVLIYSHSDPTDQVLDALNLAPRDLFDEPKGARYDYPDGRQVYRSPEKKFRQAGNTKGTSLFRSDRLAKATAVYVVEGEKDVFAAESIGLVATCTPMGAGKAHLVDLTPLHGKTVVIVADKDEPGRKHAEQIAELLDGKAGVTIAESAVGKDLADHVAAGLDASELVVIRAAVKNCVAVAEPAEEKTERKSAATQLVELAMARYTLGVTPEGDPYAIAKSGGHVARSLRGGKAGLRAELSREYFRTFERAAPQQALADALLVLEGESCEAEPASNHLRVAESDGAIYLDVGDVAESVIRIDRSGRWEYGNLDVPVLFRRTVLTGPFPEPSRDGDLEALWSTLNVAESDRALLLAAMVAALIAPDVPHPVLALAGEQGTAKTTTTKTVVALTDPSSVPVRKPPRDMDSWVTAAAGSWVVGIDNISTIGDWFSDSLCRAATGEGDVKRALYTDSGLSVVAFRRVIVVNGIDWGAMRGDLAERSLIVTLERIPPEQRRSEADLAESWATVYPSILGGLLDLAATVYSILPTVVLAESPRMADFARILAAVDQVIGTAGLARYAGQSATLAADTIASDPFLAAVTESVVYEFEGSAAEILAMATPVSDRWRAPRGWPRSARSVTSTLRRSAPALRSMGWSVENLGSANKDKTVRWRLMAPRPEIARNEPSPYPPNPPSEHKGSSEGVHGGGLKAGKADSANPPPRSTNPPNQGTNPPNPPNLAAANPLTRRNGDSGYSGDHLRSISACRDCGAELNRENSTGRCAECRLASAS